MTDLVQEVTQEARADVEGRQEEHVQPEDEAVLRLPGDVRARPRSVPAELPAGGRRQPQHLGGPRRRGAPKLKADRAPGRPRHVERDRLEHAPDVAPLLLRRLHPERGEPDRHRSGLEPEGRDRGPAGHARHLPERHDRRGLRLDRGVEQPGIRRRPAVRGAERDLDRAHGGELRKHRRSPTTPGSPRSRAAR